MYSTEKYPSKILQEAVETIGSLPGVGSRSALRLALHLLGQPAEQIYHFTEAVNRLADDVHYCHICQMIADADTCSICADHTRDARTICVVESVRDVMSIEATGQYRGVYHVLGGIISPIDGVGPSDLKIKELVERIDRMHTEDAATEDLLDSWAGTLIVVSHDRYLLERVCDQLYAIVDGTLRHLPRGVDEYLELVAASQGGAARKQPAEAPANQEAKPGGSLGNAERHKLRKQLAALERKMHTATDKLGQAKAELDACDPYDYVALGEAQARVSERSAALAELENLWLELSESLEADGNALE